MNNEFFIYKYSYLKTKDIDLSFIPMLIRRRLSKLTKIAFSTMYECFEGKGEEILFASQYGEFESLTKLINQYRENNEVSPTIFSNSVHNCSVGNFAILNNYKENYNAVSSENETISNTLAEIITTQKNLLICYADICQTEQSFSCLTGKVFRKNSIRVKLEQAKNISNENEYSAFIKFLKNETPIYKAPYFNLRRIDD